MRQGIQARHPMSLTQDSETQARGSTCPAEMLHKVPTHTIAAGLDSEQPLLSELFQKHQQQLQRLRKVQGRCTRQGDTVHLCNGQKALSLVTQVLFRCTTASLSKGERFLAKS